MKNTIPILATSMLFNVACQTKVNDTEQNENKKPNILFILADDLGYHDLSITGSTFYETPNIDKIGLDGICFSDSYSTCQVCSPSRASIMSGKFPARHGITDWIGARSGEEWRKQGRHNQLLPAEYNHDLPHDYTILPEALKEAGYKTFFAGKWHLGDEGSWPEDHGFDINKGGWSVGSPKGGYYAPWENPRLENGPDGESLTMRLAHETANFIKENKDTSFFAFLSFYAVHSPLQTTEEKWAKYQKKATEQGIRDSGFEMGHLLPIRQVQDNPVYAGLVETMDDAVGLVLQTLEELHLSDNTIIIFTSDNGGVVAGDAYATSNKPLRAGKGYQYEGGIRVPCLMKIPGSEMKGIKSNLPVTGADFYPSLLELAGASQRPEEHMDGLNIIPLLKIEDIPERSFIWHYPHYGNQGGVPSSIIRKGKWKLIHYYEDGHQELYDLNADLEETTDVSVQHTEIRDQLNEKLFNYLNQVNARFPQKDPQYDEMEEKNHLERIKNEVMPRLEKQRIEFLSKDYNPKNNWWGSKI